LFSGLTSRSPLEGAGRASHASGVMARSALTDKQNQPSTNAPRSSTPATKGKAEYVRAMNYMELLVRRRNLTAVS